MVVVKAGKVVAVGKPADVKIPDGVAVRKLPDAVIIPGLVDTHSHIGVYSRPGVPANSDGNEMSGPVQSGVRAIDAVYVEDPGFKMAIAGGLTTVNIMPGSANVIGGQTIYVKPRGNTVEEMRIVDDRTLGGLKMANGENPKGYGRNKSQAPFTRMKVASLQREQFVKAREYQKKLKAYQAKKEGPAPEVDLSLVPLVEVLDKKRTVHFHCHRADDLMTALRIAEEFDFEIVLQHASEGYRIADELARRKIPVSLTLVDSPGGKAETMGLIEENAAILEKAGVKVAINTDDSVTESRFFLRTGSIAVRGGMSEAAALKALTIHSAEMLKLDHRIGSIAAGKDADFVILSGPPFAASTLVLETYIDGKKLFDRASKADYVYQAGGFLLRDVKKLPDAPVPLKVLAPAKVPEVPKDAPKPKPGQNSWVVTAGRVHIGDGKVIEPGVVVVENGKIKDVFKLGDKPLPAGMPVLSAAEVTPGLIDAQSSVGLSGAWNIPADQDQDEMSDSNQPDLRVIDGFNPDEGLMEYLRMNGVTVIHAVPGRQNVVAGQTGIFRTAGTRIDQMTVRFPAAMLVNLGESAKGKGGNTRMGTAQTLRKSLQTAANYQAKKDAPYDMKAEGWKPMLGGKLPTFFAAHRADDLVTALRIAEEFKLRPVLALASEAYFMADALAAKKIPVVAHPTMERAASSMETANIYTGTTMVLQKAGVLTAIGTGFEGYVPKTRMLRSEAAIAAAHGTGRAGALRAVTLDAAKLLEIDKDYGSLEAGKVADLVLYDGDPLENYSHVEQTLIGGKVVFRRADYLKIPFARRVLPMLETGSGGCCLFR